MSPTNEPLSDAPGGAPAPRPTAAASSRFTLASVAFGLSILSPVPCCPFVGFISTPLAIASLWRLRASADLRARRLARAAMILSLVGLVVQAVTYEALSDWLRKSLDRSMNTCVRAAFADDYSKCVIAMAPNPLAPAARSAPTKEQLTLFAAEAAKRYGILQEVTFISQVGDGGLLDVAMTSAITLKFERRETTGSVVFQLVPQNEQWTPATRLIELTVDDSSLGDLVLAPTPPAKQP
ncbi:MAG: hypothetical protein K8R92_06090 [Planctomycetes bacterium]|nr:hypothetical protein [Planctomycetota bacterium]